MDKKILMPLMAALAMGASANSFPPMFAVGGGRSKGRTFNAPGHAKIRKARKLERQNKRKGRACK